MSGNDPDIGEEQLHAYVDGLLDDDAGRRVVAWLARNPDSARDVAGWQRQNEALRTAFDSYAISTNSDSRRLQPSPRRAITWRAAAAVLLFGAGVASGYFAFASSGQIAGDSAAVPFAQQAMVSFAIYASEVRHPVEVGSDQKDHLVKWLGKRLDHPLLAPDLTSLEYNLVGGRLLPVNNKAGAMLMYENKTGQRLTLLVGRNPAGADTGFRFSTNGAVRTFTWIDGPIGYAISGEISRPDLEKAADIIYRQLETPDIEG